MEFFGLFCLINLSCLVQGIVYDSYNGNQLSNVEYHRRVKDNTTFWCVTDIRQCDPNEWRRVDGSCNNLQHPTRGASHTPFYRVLLPEYGKDFEPRKSKSGKPLPLVRRLRTNLLADAQRSDDSLTMLASYYLVFISADITNLHDTVNYIEWTKHCCTEKGKTDDMCAPVQVPADDPVHQFTNIRCFNLTKPFTFQTFGCRKKDTVPERIMSATPLFDLSTVYGNEIERSLEGRLYKDGLLKYEIEDERVWPPQEPNRYDCITNRRPRETRCHKTPSDEINTLMPINIVSIWFWRLHNKIASELATVNPCWDDEELYNTARDINIAIESQILFYDMLPALMGYDRLVQDGILSPTLGFRDLYNDSFVPQLSMEFPMTLRWFHKMQEGKLKLFNENGEYVKNVRIVDLTMRTGFLSVDNNIDYLTQGSFRQASGKVDDHVVDPDMAEKVLGPIQPAQDVYANDMAKNRLMFFPPYVKYLEYCFGESVSRFDDLQKYFKPEVLERLSEMYESVDDIDLLAAMWVEKIIEGGRVPHTLYCLFTEQLLRMLRSDRHWYERQNRPHAFSTEQLAEIRKASMARLLCDVGDTVTHIQPKAFIRIGPGNEMQSCDDIPSINWMAWKDNSCECD